MLTIVWEGTFTRGHDRRTYRKTFMGLLNLISQQMRNYVDAKSEQGWTLQDNKTVSIKAGPQCRDQTED